MYIVAREETDITYEQFPMQPDLAIEWVFEFSNSPYYGAKRIMQ